MQIAKEICEEYMSDGFAGAGNADPVVCFYIKIGNLV